MRRAVPQPFSVMAGLGPAIHEFCSQDEDVDARDKPVHDGKAMAEYGCLPRTSVRLFAPEAEKQIR
jgi:hypothetical protein